MAPAIIRPALTPTVLPICTIQHDFSAVLAEVRDGLVPEDKFWLSCYKHGQPSVHGRVIAHLDERDRDLVRLQGKDGVEIIQHIQSAVYSAACPALEIPHTRLVLPIASYPDPPSATSRRSHQVTAFDVAPDGSQFATGYHDGSVLLRAIPIATSPILPYASAKSHLSTITSLRFFPSSRVLLSAGADFSLHILPAEPPSSLNSPQVVVESVRTFRGHTRAVTDTVIISRGRNFLSSSKDATLRLWDVPSGSQIRSIALRAPVMKLSIGERPSGAPNGASAPSGTDADIDPREVDTSDKLAFAALADGSFAAIDLRVKHPIVQSAAAALDAPATSTAALSAIAHAPRDSLLATGTVSGEVRIFDIRTVGAEGAHAELAAFRRNSASIEDVSFVSLRAGAYSHALDGAIPGDALGLAIATSDGLPYVARLQTAAVDVGVELVGLDCDAVRVIRTVPGREGGEEIWTAGDDGVVRRYAPRA
ncbi:WD40 repeat-like protein [Obba rivulosa]|uniref:WD40 repeat-like protein n=1 Tax=Obba rivulosa TaxID=1052685 RepID=A0A8E2DI30_9APHY|nr:WD40 repeat-like protein [Obba rivulosa]